MNAHATKGTSGEAKTQRSTANRRDLARFKRTLRQHLPELRERYGIRSFGIFGSYVHGEAKKSSDLDLLVEFDRDRLTLLGFIQLENHLSDLLGVKVDLVEKETLKPYIGRRILQEVVPV